MHMVALALIASLCAAIFVLGAPLGTWLATLFAPSSADCDCTWAHGGRTCGHDDGSACWRVCCGTPSPSPTPSPPSPPSPSPRTTYCPNPATDFNIDYGHPVFTADGWRIQGGGRVSSKASFNFAGGFLEFDMDLASARGGVNTNVYATFPKDGHSYCDSGGRYRGCAEMDFTENNGHCWQATTWHHDRSGQDHSGVAQESAIGPQVHIRASWSDGGHSLGIRVGGSHHSGEGFADVMSQVGAVLYSSQWTGWVPGSCGGDGNLGASSFSVSNLKLSASVIQGAEPRVCATAQYHNRTETFVF